MANDGGAIIKQNASPGTKQTTANANIDGTLTAGGFSDKIISKAANYTVTNADGTILASAASAPITITLPTAAGIAGRSYLIKRTDSTPANAVTVATTSAQTINGTRPSFVLAVKNQWIAVKSDGSNWWITDSRRSSVIDIVEDFGCIGDGATDNITAWNAAVAALTPGAVFLIPAGSFLLNSIPSTFPAGTVVAGAGRGISMILHGSGVGGTFANFLAAGGDRVTFRDYTVDGQNSVNTTFNGQEISANGKTGVVFDSVEVKNFQVIGIDAHGSGTLVSGCTVTGPGAAGRTDANYAVWCDNATSVATIVGCVLSNCRAAAFFGGGRSQFIGNYVFGNGWDAGGQVAPSSNSQAGASVLGNYIGPGATNQASGIEAQGDVLIADNVLNGGGANRVLKKSAFCFSLESSPCQRVQI